MPIIDYTPEPKASPFAELVATELAALLKAGEGKATQVEVPTRGANRFRVEFARAANQAGKTARIQSSETDGKTDKDGKPSGNTTFIFTLTDRHKQRRGKSVEVSES